MLSEPFSSLFDASRQRSMETTGSPRAFVPSSDLLVSQDEAMLVMDVPGFKAEDLQIELRDGLLKVWGERRYPYATDREGRNLYRLERGFGRFERVLQIPKEVDADALEAEISDGVLRLKIPFPEARKPHRVEIKSGGRPTPIDAEAASAESPSRHATATAAEEERRNGDRELAGVGS